MFTIIYTQHLQHTFLSVYCLTNAFFLLQGHCKIKAKKKPRTPVSSSSNKKKHGTSSLKENQVQPSKTQRIKEKGKVDGSSKSAAQSKN